MLVVHFDQDEAAEKVRTNTSYFKISVPSLTPTQGIFDLRQTVLQQVLGITTITNMTFHYPTRTTCSYRPYPSILLHGLMLSIASSQNKFPAFFKENAQK